MVRDGARAPPHHEGQNLPLRPLVEHPSCSPEPHPEERRLCRVSKDEATAGSSWFETAQGRLLTMRGKTYGFGRLSNTHLAAQNLILRSGVFAASRRMGPPPELRFETAQGRLLTMRCKTHSFGRLSTTRLALPSERSSVSGSIA